jgi:hypothetical protein
MPAAGLGLARPQPYNYGKNQINDKRGKSEITMDTMGTMDTMEPV